MSAEQTVQMDEGRLFNFSGQPARSMGGRDTREKIADGETRWRSSQEGTGLHLFFQLVCCAVYTLIHTNNHTQVKVKTLHVHIFAHGLRGASVS